MRNPGCSSDGIGDVGEDVTVLFNERAYVAAQADESPRTCHGAQAAADLLLDLGHADALLGDVVRERHLRIVDEAQHGVAVLDQAFVEISRLALRDASAPTGPRGRRRKLRDATCQDGLVFGLEKRHGLWRKRRVRTRGPQPGQVEQPLEHLEGPGLLLLLVSKLQLAQEMRSAQAVRAALIREIRRPTVVHQPAPKLRQDPLGLHGLPPALVIEVIQRQPRRRYHVQPARAPRHPQSRLVCVRHRRRSQLRRHFVHEGLEVAVRVRFPAHAAP